MKKLELLLISNFFYFKFVFNFDLENPKTIFLNYSHLTTMTILNCLEIFRLNTTVQRTRTAPYSHVIYFKFLIDLRTHHHRQRLKKLEMIPNLLIALVVNVKWCPTSNFSSSVNRWSSNTPMSGYIKLQIFCLEALKSCQNVT